MKILCKVVDTGLIVERVIEDVDYISVGRKSLSYRFRNKQRWIHTLRLDSCSHVRILDDGAKNEN